MPHSHDVTRRTWIRRAALGTVGLASGAHRLLAQPPAGRPNIVFILADDLGYADVACYGRPDLSTPNIDRLAADGVRFLQAYANSAVCTATRVALITGRYQYRLRSASRSRCRLVTRRVGLPPAASHAAVAAEEAPATARRSSASGIWARCRRSVRCRAATTTSTASAAARVDYYSHHGTDQKDDLWDDDVAIHQVGYLTDLLGDRAVERDQRLREVRPAVLPEPPLQRAALAVGSARRRSGVDTDRRRRPAALRRRHAEDLSANDRGDGRCRSAACSRRSRPTV